MCSYLAIVGFSKNLFLEPLRQYVSSQWGSSKKYIMIKYAAGIVNVGFSNSLT
jgi:hypothetical protein